MMPATTKAQRVARGAAVIAAAAALERALWDAEVEVSGAVWAGCDCCGSSTQPPAPGWAEDVVERLVAAGAIVLPDRGA